MLSSATLSRKNPVRRRGKIYIRVSSTKGRDELYSPELQEMACRQKAEMENIEVLDVIYDLDMTGRDFAKRKIADMIEEVRLGAYEVVILWRWSRFGRNLRHSLNNLHELEQVGGVAVSATEPGDSVTTMGRFSRNQMLLIAEFQSDQISDGWKETHEFLLASGLPHHGREIFGYIRKDKRYHPEPLRSDALAEVYTRYVDGETFRTIALDMADAGIRNTKGAVIGITEWLKIMETGFAAGLIRRRKPGAKGRRFDQWDWHPGAHEAIISPELWQAFHDKRMSSLGRNWASTKAKYSLSGLLHCFRCDKRMTATSNGKPNKATIFRCEGISTGECRGVQIVLTKAEKTVLEWVQSKAKGLDTVDELTRMEAARKTAISDSSEIRAKLAEIDKRLSRLLDLYENGDIEREEYVRRKSEREMEKAALNQKLNELGIDIPENKPLPATFFTDLETAWPILNHDEKRNLLRKVISKIIIHGAGHEGGRVEIVPKYEAA